ncbi:MAG: B12-binding domain-containing radical SAM protein [Candidatus Omnitrophota bacterium]|nr:radical SAM protein [Candidatus Omnitrophota bacterium]
MNILAINPWIYDFAAYDFWLKPYGFLVILTYLKNKGVNVDYIDCLDEKITKADFGRGKYPSQIIDKPPIFKHITRFFKRYGISIDKLKSSLKKTKYDYILITSSMTYWYPAISDLITLLKAQYPNSKIVLGGTYATLCYDHAKKNIDCDYIFKTTSLKDFFKLLDIDFDNLKFYSTLPSYDDFYNNLDYVVFRASWGCPFNCSYCAIKKLSNGFFRIFHKPIVEFIKKHYQNGITNYILYDDAFLYKPAYAKQLLTEIRDLNLNIHFHTPNALHLKFLNKDISSLLKDTGFINPHFGLETLNASLQKQWGNKVNNSDLKKGINLLKKGGFKNGEFSVYLLLGYPNQNLDDLKKEAYNLHSLGAKISLAEFSPVPKTKLFQQYKDKFSDPLMHNNSIFGSFQQKKIKDFWEIKNYVRALNKILSTRNILR